MAPDRFATFILSHGRPEQVMTVAALRRSGYTGRTYLVIDDEDETAEAYRARFGAENVLMFSKAAVAETFDTADTQSDRRSVVYARNASFALARELGLRYFLELDDDYQFFGYRWPGGVSTQPRVKSFDAVVDAMLAFLEDSSAVTVAFAQGGDFIGGARDGKHQGLKRKAMNALFLRTDRPVTFLGRINEDVSTYVLQGSRGDLFLTVMGLQLVQRNTQQATGGMTALYLEAGTYVKSFYTVMMAPSCVTIRRMGHAEPRLHHNVEWDRAVPKILSPEYRKDADA